MEEGRSVVRVLKDIVFFLKEQERKKEMTVVCCDDEKKTKKTQNTESFLVTIVGLSDWLGTRFDSTTLKVCRMNEILI